MISITEMKVIENIIEICGPVLYHNKKYTPMYGSSTEECDDAKKVMGEVLSILTWNGLCNILCEQYWDRNFKFTIG